MLIKGKLVRTCDDLRFYMESVNSWVVQQVLPCGSQGLTLGDLVGILVRLILERVKSELGFNKTLEALGITRGSLYNYLNGVRRIPDNVDYKEV
jgi:hypothetical protein